MKTKKHDPRPEPLLVRLEREERRRTSLHAFGLTILLVAAAAVLSLLLQGCFSVPPEYQPDADSGTGGGTGALGSPNPASTTAASGSGSGSAPGASESTSSSSGDPAESEGSGDTWLIGGSSSSSGSDGSSSDTGDTDSCEAWAFACSGALSYEQLVQACEGTLAMHSGECLELYSDWYLCRATAPDCDGTPGGPCGAYNVAILETCT